MHLQSDAVPRAGDEIWSIPSLLDHGSGRLINRRGTHTRPRRLKGLLLGRSDDVVHRGELGIAGEPTQ